MSLFDTLFGNFTGAPAIDAANSARQNIEAQYGEISRELARGEQRGVNYLRGGLNSAVSALGPSFDQARTDVSGGAARGATTLGSAYDQAREDVSGAAEQAIMGNVYNDPLGGTTYTPGVRGYGQEALSQLRGDQGFRLGEFDPLQALGHTYGAERGQASRMSADALGLNGPGGNARATGAFQAGPGYEFMMDEGLNAITRAGSAAGMPASGNVLRESQRYGSGLANQEYGNWLNRVSGREQFYAPLEASATGAAAAGRAGVRGDVSQRSADIYSGVGRSVADLMRGEGEQLSRLSAEGGRSLADLQAGEGQRLGALSATQGPAIAGLYTNEAENQARLMQALLGEQAATGRSVIAPTASTFGAAAQAQMQGSQNIWNLLGNVASAIF